MPSKLNSRQLQPLASWESRYLMPPSESLRALAAQTRPRPTRQTSRANRYKPSVPQVLSILQIGAPKEQTAAALARLFKSKNVNAFLFALNAAKWTPEQTAPRTHVNGRPVRYNSPANNVNNIDRMAAAAYIHGAALRALARANAGTSTQISAISDERRYAAAHAEATRQRSISAQRLATAQKAYGNMLGWYTRNDGKVESRCRKLAGNNFRADRPLPVGYPGVIHPDCRCWAGPPFTKGVLLN